ncbi:hypothetical protein [Methylobacterium sp. Leaf88]|uniref:hypothetical protein n=1 Tax=Methylobacterium sp. Leaf88 TaxID=1736244 RepID=UPI0006F700F6|nr:hypothetical protein [Methylobacterium sp. Leaf88]KQO74455.1 hypothetical protein ASF20_04155 [Methylobacterium sp. Leaf88]
MEAFLASGHLVDAILLLVAIEALGLILWSRRAQGVWPLALLCNLTAGAALMLALRGALTGAGWPVIAGCLAGAGLAHLTEMALRLGLLAPPVCLRDPHDTPI